MALQQDRALDLSFARFEPDAQAAMASPELAVLLVGVTARQAASPTAQTQVRIEQRPATTGAFAPADGAFSGSVARLLSNTVPAQGPDR